MSEMSLYKWPVIYNLKKENRGMGELLCKILRYSLFTMVFYKFKCKLLFVIIWDCPQVKRKVCQKTATSFKGIKTKLLIKESIGSWYIFIEIVYYNNFSD